MSPRGDECLHGLMMNNTWAAKFRTYSSFFSAAGASSFFSSAAGAASVFSAAGASSFFSSAGASSFFSAAAGAWPTAAAPVGIVGFAGAAGLFSQPITPKPRTSMQILRFFICLTFQNQNRTRYTSIQFSRQNTCLSLTDPRTNPFIPGYRSLRWPNNGPSQVEHGLRSPFTSPRPSSGRRGLQSHRPKSGKPPG